ncbi:MAG TPA: permease prefix domain 1-containing protein, partial [Streptosporangiaceae bacterium]
MPGPRLIAAYLAELSAELPGRIVDELADGLDETYRRYLRQGLDPEAAARAAVAEFGEPRVIVAAFTDASRSRRTARRLLAAGPLVGICWAVVLISARAWTWPIPAVARVLFGAALITVLGLLAAAALGRHYRQV